jgi:ActR/RegA family two-component response regulator
MAYQAVLFCQDGKLARILSQVFAEVDFNVDHASDPFTIVKKLMERRYDAIVVDCDNEQNSTLIFKSAHNSAVNKNCLAIAVVEGQYGVARAYRIGASLVLTKPINVEHVKGTLRVARGLLRKNADAATSGHAAVSAPATCKPAASPRTPAVTIAPAAPMAAPTSAPAVPSMTAAPSVSAAAAPALSLSKSKTPNEPILQERRAGAAPKSQSAMPTPAEPAMTQSSVTMTSLEIEEALDRIDEGPAFVPAPMPASSAHATSSLAAKTAVAPKKAKGEDDDEVEFTFDTPAGEPPLMSVYDTVDESAKHAPNRSKIFIVVMIIFAVLIIAYYAWNRIGPGAHPSGSAAPQQKLPLACLQRGTTNPSAELALLRVPPRMPAL